MGNPYVDIEISIKNDEYQWSHGLISDETYQLTQTICNNSRLWIENYVYQNTSEVCNNIFYKKIAEIGDINMYDVTLDDCLSNNAPQTQLSKLQEGVSTLNLEMRNQFLLNIFYINKINCLVRF